MLTRPFKAFPPNRPLYESLVETPLPAFRRGLFSPATSESPKSPAEIQVATYSRLSLESRLPALTEFVRNSSPLVPLSRHPAWLNILQKSLGHESYAIEATAEGRTVGFLPLAYLDSLLFGNFLVSLPYLNTNGVVAADPAVRTALVARAITLSEELNARHLELRQETAIEHPGLNARIASKVHMRLGLPKTVEQLWKRFDPKVRNQIRKGEKPQFPVVWGGEELLEPFYAVLSQNMRDLGSPAYDIGLFREILHTFPDRAELCVVEDGSRAVACAILLHGWGVTEVPTASSLKAYNPTSVNMLMYWQLLKRSIERGQRIFDFGRSTSDGSTFKFKKQWGAEPDPAIWQYRVNRGEVGEMRPDNPRFLHAIRIWQKLPLAITRFVGPRIIRGIP